MHAKDLPNCKIDIYSSIIHHRQTDRQIDRQTDRQIERKKGRQTDRQIDRQKDRQIDLRDKNLNQQKQINIINVVRFIGNKTITL